MAGSGLPAIRNGYQQPSGDHANGRGLPNDDIRHRVTEIRCRGTVSRFSTLTISAVGDREIRAAKIGTRPAARIPEKKLVHVLDVGRTKWNINNMDFLSDLTQAIVSEFTERGISFPECADPAHLSSRYFEMRIRRIEPIPRQVYFSKEIHGSLGDLARNNDPQRRQKALAPTVFYHRHLSGHPRGSVAMTRSRLETANGP